MEENSTAVGTSDSPFTERILRTILDLTAEQQLELVQALAHPDKDQRITTKYIEKSRSCN